MNEKSLIMIFSGYEEHKLQYFPQRGDLSAPALGFTLGNQTHRLVSAILSEVPIQCIGT